MGFIIPKTIDAGFKCAEIFEGIFDSLLDVYHGPQLLVVACHLHLIAPKDTLIVMGPIMSPDSPIGRRHVPPNLSDLK
jgi:hypothetical protein